MNFLQRSGRIQNLLNNKFIRNLSWLGASELINRVFRLGTTVILARFLMPHDYGLAAIILTITDLVQILSLVGITDKIIQAPEEGLDELCNASYWLNWTLCCALFSLQCLIAFPVAWFYNDTQLILPICLTALIFLVTPLGSIQYVLILRENRLKVVAINNTIQLTASNIMTAVFAVFGLGLWAIVLPRVLIAPVWAYSFHTNHSWRPTVGFTTQGWGEIIKFGKHILGVQLLKALRNNLDYLIVGRFIGMDELGIYYFAFNAGLGISLSVITSLNSAMLPHLCSVRTEWSKFKQTYMSTLKTIAVVIVPLVLVQSTLAPLYVPIVFGQKWVPAIPVLILICLSAIPRPFADAASQLLVATDKPHFVLRWDVLFTIFFTGALLIGVQWNSFGVASAVLLLHVIALPLFTLWATRHVFDKSSHTPYLAARSY